MPETKDLILRKAVMEDWPNMLHNIWSKAESAKYMFWDLTTTEEAAIARMERTIAYQEARDYHWTVVEKASGQAIGWAGMEEISEGVWGETGIAIGPAFIGQGYGTQLLNCLTNYARDSLDAKYFIACCRTENQASKGMMLHCNFSFTHSKEAVHSRDGDIYTMDYYAKEL